MLYHKYRNNATVCGRGIQLRNDSLNRRERRHPLLPRRVISPTTDSQGHATSAISPSRGWLVTRHVPCTIADLNVVYEADP